MKLCGFDVGEQKPFFLLAGPCIVESEQLAIDTAGVLKELTNKLKINFIYKSSLEKANRTSHLSYKGLGFEAALKILAKVKQQIKVSIITDVHEDTPIDEVISVVDVLQTPAFLCRQTNFIQKIASYKLPMNIKKGQFLAPWDMKHVVAKVREVGNDQAMVCERGVSFGYNNLISDMRSLAIMKEIGCPVVFDATHSVQLPGAQGLTTGGEREFVPVLSRAAVAVGVDGIFMETHPEPDKALCDGPNSWPLKKMRELLEILQNIDRVVKPKGLTP